MMNILFILQYVPYPVNSGGNQATFNMIDKARRQHHVSVLFNIANGGSEAALQQLRPIWSNVTFYTYQEPEVKPMPKPTSLAFRICEYFQKMFTRKVNRKIRKYHASINKADKSEIGKENKETDDFVRLNSCLNHPYPSFTDGYKNFVYQVSRKGFDAIQIEFFECIPLVYLLPENVCKIYVQHEIRYIRNKNELDLFKQQTTADFYLWRVLKDMELSALRHYDYVVALTEIDKQLMLADDKDLNIFVSPAVVRLSDNKFSCTQTATELVFVGSGEHFPNADGVMWFCQEVLPLLKQKSNDIKVNIVGKWSQAQQQDLTAIEPSLNFTGYVDDLESYMNGKISIVPIRIGSGMRMKLLDSVISASPIVTTSKGCEGLPFANGETCLIADTPSDFANAIEQMLNNENNIQKTFVDNAFSNISSIIDANQQIQRRMSLYQEIEKQRRR